MPQTFAQTAFHSFTLRQVKLLPGVYKNAQEVDMRYMLALEPDRLLAPYCREAGLTPKKKSYSNWENTGLDGHMGGHYLSALSFMLAATGDSRMSRRLDYMLSELKRCQDHIGTGYLGGTPGGILLWQEIASGKIEVDTFALNGKWVPLYNLHKLMAGLRDAYITGGKPLALQLLTRLVDYIDQVAGKLSDTQIQQMLISEQGGLNEVFADLAAITGNKKYLVLARRFSHRQLLDPLVLREDHLDGLHANMQIPKAVGFQRIAEVGGDSNYAKAAHFFWETVTSHRSVVIGGNSVNEHFNRSDDFHLLMNEIAGPETCNTYNMLKLTKHLFETEGSVSYLDFYERALYNHILSSEHPVRGGFVYYTPVRPRHYRTYSQPDLCMWCCVGSGMENHGKYGELIYSYRNQDLYVNLFIASRLHWAARGLIVSQHTLFPEEDKTELLVEAAPADTFRINIRYPGWVSAGALEVKVNGRPVSFHTLPDAYISLNRRWKKGDKIEVRLPMKITAERLPDNSPFFAFLYGPVVLAAKTDTTGLDNLVGDDDQFGGYRAKGKIYPLNDVPYLAGAATGWPEMVKPVPGKSLTFTMPDLIQPAEFKKSELIPFYKLHDARYMIYWQWQQ